MKCPYCTFAENKVIDKRESEDGKITRRRRQCLKCSKRFTTFERVETLDILVVKKDNKRELFDRSKIRTGIVKSCEKRPVSAQIIETMVDEVESDIRNLATTEVSSKKIGELIIKRLKKVDEVAYIRFASVYRQFADLEDFEKELLSLTKNLKKSKTLKKASK